MEQGSVVLIIVLIILAFVIGKKGIKIVKQANVLIIERLGKFNRIAQSGINFIWPFIDLSLIHI